MGAPAGQSYPDQLQMLLDSRFGKRQCRVANFGVPGQNSSEALARLDALLARGFKPDFVLISIGENNYWNWRYATPFMPGGDSLLKIRVVLSNLRAYRFLSMVIRRGPRVFSKFFFTNKDWDDPRYNVFRRSNTAWLFRWMKADLIAMGRLCVGHGAQPVMVGYHLPSDDCDPALAQAASEQHWPHVDCRYFGGRGASDLADKLSPDGWHPNAAGYAAVANLVAGVVIPLIEKKLPADAPRISPL
jgi:lysophospholipase L1-like esterase